MDKPTGMDAIIFLFNNYHSHGVLLMNGDQVTWSPVATRKRFGLSLMYSSLLVLSSDQVFLYCYWDSRCLFIVLSATCVCC